MVQYATLCFIALGGLFIELSWADCMDGWVRYHDSCYFFGHDDKTFIEAERFCVHLHGHLANIETYAEANFIRSFLTDLKDPKHWIGIGYTLIENEWKYYPSETSVHIHDWGPSQPDQGKTSNCVAIWQSFDYRWVVEPCSNRFKPLCERPANNDEVIGR